MRGRGGAGAAGGADPAGCGRGRGDRAAGVDVGGGGVPAAVHAAWRGGGCAAALAGCPGGAGGAVEGAGGGRGAGGVEDAEPAAGCRGGDGRGAGCGGRGSTAGGQVRILEVASLAAIRLALAEDAYHVLHLSAHGSPEVVELEDEDGNPVTVSLATLVEALRLAGRVVPLIVLSSCSGGTSGAGAMAAGLAGRGADRVIAMLAPVTDEYATRLAGHLYRELAARPQLTAGQALARARYLTEDTRPRRGGPGGGPGVRGGHAGGRRRGRPAGRPGAAAGAAAGGHDAAGRQASAGSADGGADRPPRAASRGGGGAAPDRGAVDRFGAAAGWC